VAGAVDVWDRPGQSLLARWYGGIPVHRNQYDRKLIDTILAALQNGYPLLMAPEGGRSHALGMRRAQPGIAYLMEKAGVPVVPVGVTGSTDDFLKRGLRGERPDIGMKIGRPFSLPNDEKKGANRHEIRQREADFVMIQIAALLPPEYRGVYADDSFNRT
jgi:1-acyl-sn-glycerol-3-phosphate acyltransferase